MCQRNSVTHFPLSLMINSAHRVNSLSVCVMGVRVCFVRRWNMVWLMRCVWDGAWNIQLEQHRHNTEILTNIIKKSVLVSMMCVPCRSRSLTLVDTDLWCQRVLRRPHRGFTRSSTTAECHPQRQLASHFRYVHARSWSVHNRWSDHIHIHTLSAVCSTYYCVCFERADTSKCE